MESSSMVGRQFGTYRITARIGAGGMGEVYRAHDATLNRDVAIKFLAPDFAGDERAGRRLLREARAAAALDHPNICTIYEVGELDDFRFIVMQFVEGETLAARLRRNRLTPSDAVSIAVQIADALDAAHKKGMVHRDIKPENVMVTASGRVTVLDFGLAQFTTPVVAQAATETVGTSIGSFAGTIPYMSPEQVRGEELDTRSDIFSLGTLILESLTGSHPFTGPSTADTIAAILSREPAAIRDVPAPGELRHVIRKCLEKDRGRRYQSTTDLADQLRSIRLLFDTNRSAAAASGPLAPPPALTAAANNAPFVGRESELRAMSEAWNGANAGRRHVILVGGEPGIGKSRLCLEFARARSSEGATVLIGRSDEQALLPYQPFIEALSWYVRECSDEELFANLSAIGGGAELAVLLPDLTRRVVDLPAVQPMNPEGQRFRLFEAVSGLLAAMSRTAPTLVVFDDLHWADQASLLLLRHVARATDPARLCIVGNYRESEVSRRHPLAEMLGDLRRQPFVNRIQLEGLTSPQVGELVGSLAGRSAPQGLVHAIADSSGGNPFFVGEMLRHLSETGALAALQTMLGRPELGVPDAVRDVIRHRLSRLSENCNRVLTVGAVIGQEFPLALVEAISGLSEDPLIEVIEEAIRAQIIVEIRGVPDRCRFVHALIRETLYAELSGLRAARLHRKIGETIEQTSNADPPLADLAYHFGRATATGAVEKAVDYATRAGDRATSTLAHEEAARFYQNALDALETAQPGPATAAKRVDLHARRGRTFTAIGDWPRAYDAFEYALRHGTDEPTAFRCELLVGKAEAAFWMSKDVDEVQGIATEACERAEQLPGRPDLVGAAVAALARCHAVTGRLASAIDLNLAAIERAGSHRTLAHAFAPVTLYMAGRMREAVSLGRTAAEMARASRDTNFTMNALPHFAISLAATGQYGEAQQVFNEAREYGRKYGAVAPLARAISFAAGMHLGVFDFEGAADLQREAREMAASAGIMPPFISSGIDMLLTFARTHNPGAAEGLLKNMTSSALNHPWHRGLWTLRLSQVRAELALARGELETAAEEAVTALTESRTMGRLKYESLALTTRAGALAGLERTREAIAAALEALAAARRTSDPALVLQALDVFLQLEGSDEALAEARELVHRISEALPDERMSRAFCASEVVQRVQRL